MQRPAAEVGTLPYRHPGEEAGNEEFGAVRVHHGDARPLPYLHPTDTHPPSCRLTIFEDSPVRTGPT
ncbi:hypothetical protein P3T22_003458 [Paraburkholderia sp. GAS348]